MVRIRPFLMPVVVGSVFFWGCSGPEEGTTAEAARSFSLSGHLMRMTLIFLSEEYGKAKVPWRSCRNRLRDWERLRTAGMEELRSENGDTPARIEEDLIPGMRELCEGLKAGDREMIRSGRRNIRAFYTWYTTNMDMDRPVMMR